jgi:hypothetical protein
MQQVYVRSVQVDHRRFEIFGCGMVSVQEHVKSTGKHQHEVKLAIRKGQTVDAGERVSSHARIIICSNDSHVGFDPVYSFRHGLGGFTDAQVRLYGDDVDSCKDRILF